MYYKKNNLTIDLDINYKKNWYQKLNKKNWYQKLNKSKLNPPAYVFGPVWTFLYLSMAFFIYNIISINYTKFLLPLVLFSIQLYFNLIWPTIFFKQNNFSKAFNYLIITLVFTILTMIETFKINPKISYILIPYLLWLSLAAYLNYFILKNN